MLDPTIPRSPLLVVEDEVMIGLEVVSMLEELGHGVVGPVTTVDQALTTLASNCWSGAVLDVNLRGTKVWPVAHELQRLGIKFIFLTGYASLSAFPSEFISIARLDKPVRLEDLEAHFPRAPDGSAVER